MPDGPRKRSSHERDPVSPPLQNVDETSPIANREATQAREYNSIAASDAHRERSAADSKADELAPLDGAAGIVGRGETQRRTSAEREAAAIERVEQGRWRAFWEKYGSVELENKGSVARDHLALERTFLAWLRTSLSFASIGIAITQLFRLNTNLSNPSRHKSNTNTQVMIEESAFSTMVSAETKLRQLGKPLGATFIGISIVMLLIGFHRYFEAQHYVIRGKFPASRGSILIVTAISGALILSSLIVILVTGSSTFES